MIYVTLAIMLIAAVSAIFLTDTLLSVLSLATVSAVLGIVFFQIGAPVAGVFELSVGAGLITVLVVLTISFIQSRKEKKAEHKVIYFIFAGLLALAFAYLGLKLAGVSSISNLVEASWGDVGKVFWKERSFDILPQALIILSTAFGILTLLRSDIKGDK